MQPEIRHIKSLPEVRRVIRSLSLAMTADRAKLAGIRRQINLAALRGPEIVLAYRTKGAKNKPKTAPAKSSPKSSKPKPFSDVDDDWDDNVAPAPKKRGRPAGSGKKTAPAPEPVVEKRGRGRPRKPAEDLKHPRKGEPTGRPRGRPPGSGKAQSLPPEDTNTAVEPPKKLSRGINVRGPNVEGPAATPSKSLDRKARQQIEELTKLLDSRHSKTKVAEHIRSLLTHYYTGDDPTAKRMQKLADALLNEHQESLDETQRTLHAMGEEYGPPQFKEMLGGVQDQLSGWLKGKFDKLSQHVAVAQGQHKGKPATFYIGYLMFDNLRGPSGTEDSVVVVTHVQQGAEDISDLREGRRAEQEARQTKLALQEAEKEAKRMAANNKRKPAQAEMALAEGKVVSQNYVLVLGEYHPPSWLLKRPLGKPFGDDIGEAVRIIKLYMQSHGMVGALNRTVAPVKNQDIEEFQHDAIERVRLVEDETVLRFFFRPSVKDKEAATEISVELFKFVKGILTRSSPRYRNKVRMLPPKTIPARTKSGKDVERFVVDFEFDKPDGVTMDISLPRDKLKQFVDDMGIEDPALVREMVVQMKRFFGMKPGADKKPGG